MSEKQYKGYKIEGVGKGKADYYVYTDLCKGCGLCIANCPMNKAGKKCLQWSIEVGLYQSKVLMRSNFRDRIRYPEQPFYTSTWYFMQFL